MATVLLLLLFACHSTVANAAVALGATRVIYPANQKQVLLPVTNNDPASVYLIQSWIENAGDQKDTQFVITPPLFSMQGKKENTLRIINATNHQLPGDRESLFWVNVKAIPAMEKDQNIEKIVSLLTRIPLQIMLNWMKPLSLSSQLTVLLPEQHLMHKSAGKY